ncbi:hypothetical protein [Rhodopseudomonas parapalustris]
MKALRFLPLLHVLVLAPLPALAAIPVEDAAQLTQHSMTSSSTVKLVPITTQRKDANGGVKCAVTTGKKASITDPTVKAQNGAGTDLIRNYAPELATQPTEAATGGALNRQTHFNTAGDVVAGIDASRSTMAAASRRLQSEGGQVGGAATVMASIDANSSVRVQNGFAWNGVIGSANLWMTALNALNLSVTGNTSSAAGGMRAVSSPQLPSPAYACPAGMVGAGTVAEPCKPAPVCSTTTPGITPDPACVSARYTDTDRNVASYLAESQSATRASAHAANPPLSVDDINAALTSIVANSR